MACVYRLSFADVFSSLKPPDNIDALNESSIGMECVCPPTCSELVNCTIELLHLNLLTQKNILALRSSGNFIETLPRRQAKHNDLWVQKMHFSTLRNGNELNDFIFFSPYSDSAEDLEDSTTLKVHFKDLTCIKYRRDMYMTWDGLFGKSTEISQFLLRN